jgi:hypothetical protein
MHMKKTNTSKNIITPIVALVAVALCSPAPAQIDPEAGTGVVNGYRIGPGVDLTFVNFSKVNLSRVNLTNADLTQSTFHGCNFTGANLSRADLSGTVFRQCQFENANLSRTRTGRLYLLAPERWIYTLFEGCRFRATDFSNADMWRADFAGISRQVRDPVNFVPNLHLGTANFLETNLRGALLPWETIDLISLLRHHAENTRQDVLQLQESARQKDRVISDLQERPTLAEVQDGRCGSVVLKMNPAGGSVTLGLTIEESVNLIDWAPLKEGLFHTIPIPGDKRFYRFALNKGNHPGQDKNQ